eukprot:scaffold49140_cov49-Attheya_sp.AAC.1
MAAAAAAAGEMKDQPQHHQPHPQPPAAAPMSYLELAGGAHRRTLPALPYQPPNTSSNPVIASRNSSYGDLGVVADSSADLHDSVVSGLTMYVRREPTTTTTGTTTTTANDERPIAPQDTKTGGSGSRVFNARFPIHLFP